MGLITKANIDKQNFNIQNEKYIEQRSKDCLDEFRKYYDNNNYERSRFDDYYGYVNDYGYSDIKYSPKTNSCIQYFEQHQTYSKDGTYNHKYKIADETNRISLYVCITSEYYSDDTLENCENGYNEKLKELGIK